MTISDWFQIFLEEMSLEPDQNLVFPVDAQDDKTVWKQRPKLKLWIGHKNEHYTWKFEHGYAWLIFFGDFPKNKNSMFFLLGDVEKLCNSNHDFG